MSEDEVSSMTASDLRKEGVLGITGLDDLFVRLPRPRDNVGWNVSDVLGFCGVVAGSVCMVFRCVTVLFRPVTFAEVVSSVEEIDCPVFDGLDVRVTALRVECSHVSAETSGENDDGMVVPSIVLVVFFDALNPMGSEHVKICEEFTCCEVVWDLCIGEEETASIDAGTSGSDVEKVVLVGGGGGHFKILMPPPGPAIPPFYIKSGGPG